MLYLLMILIALITLVAWTYHIGYSAEAYMLSLSIKEFSKRKKQFEKQKKNVK